MLCVYVDNHFTKISVEVLTIYLPLSSITETEDALDYRLVCETKLPNYVV